MGDAPEKPRLRVIRPLEFAGQVFVLEPGVHHIGRQRTNYMAISNQRVDAETALAWGLVDRLAG